MIQDDNGSYVCTVCGSMAEEFSNIVAEITFGETSSGAAVVQGQHVGAGQTHGRNATRGQRSAFGTGETTNTKEMTKNQARKEIHGYQQTLRAKGIHTPDYLLERATNFASLALHFNFVQGRSLQCVAAVAFYLACRRQRDDNQVMLIDLAEIIGINVFLLGSMYTKMVKTIYGFEKGQDLPTDEKGNAMLSTIAPENLIDRFIKLLQFPTMQIQRRIRNDAVKLVGRMDRDWMVTGRRPAGICAAAIILAARMNNFRRTVREVVLVAKVTEITLNKRLAEFSYTASSTLTVEEFRRTANGPDGPPSCDPPSFYLPKQPKNGKRGRKRKGAPETAAEIEGDEDAPADESDSAEDNAEGPSKRLRVDSEGFKIPDVPGRATQRANTDDREDVEMTQGDQTLVLGSVPSRQADRPIDEALTMAVSSAISEMESEQMPPMASQSSQTLTEPERQSSETPSEALASQPDQPRRGRGRPKGAKNWQPPPVSAAEEQLEAELESEVNRTLNTPFARNLQASIDANPPTMPDTAVRKSRTGPRAVPRTTRRRVDSARSSPAPSQATQSERSSSINDSQQVTVTDPAGSTVRAATENLPPTPELQSDAVLDDLDNDPEVSSCLLTPAEKVLKERIWVHENADWLRKDHAKKIRIELQEAADREAGIDPDEARNGKGRRGKHRKKRLGDVSYLNKPGGQDGGTATEGVENLTSEQRAAKSTIQMIQQRGYSRRINYDVLNTMYPDEEQTERERSGSTPRSKHREAATAREAKKRESRATQRESSSETTTPTATSPTSISSSEPTTTTTSTAKPKPTARPKPKPAKFISPTPVPIAEPGASEKARLGIQNLHSTAPPGSRGRGRAPGGLQGFLEREARRQLKSAAEIAAAAEQDKQEAELVDWTARQGEEEEALWRRRRVEGAEGRAAEGQTVGTALRVATTPSQTPVPEPAARTAGQLPTPANTQAQPQPRPSSRGSSSASTQVQAQPRPLSQHSLSASASPSTSTSRPRIALNLPPDSVEEELIGSVEDSPLSSLPSSGNSPAFFGRRVGGFTAGGNEGEDEDEEDEDEDEESEGDEDDYVEPDEVEAAFEGQFRGGEEAIGEKDRDGDEDEEDE